MRDDFGTPQTPQFSGSTPQIASLTEVYEKTEEPCEGSVIAACKHTPQTPQLLKTKEVEKLTGIKRRAIEDAFRRNSLEIHVDTAREGKRAGSKIHLYSLDSVFALWPQAKRAWEAQTQLAINNQKAKEAAEREAGHLADEDALKAKLRAERHALNPSNSDKGDVKRWHVMQLNVFLKEWRHGVKLGVAHYIVAIKEGRIAVPEWARRELAARTLERWRREFDKNGPGALDPNYRGCPVNHFTRHPEQGVWLESMVLNRPHINTRRLHEGLKAEFGEAVPALNAVYRWRERYERDNARELLMASNPDKAKSKYQVAFGSRSAAVVRLNQRVEFDSTKVDIMFKGDPRRYTLCAGLEVYADIMTMIVSETSSGSAQSLLLLKIFRERGLIEQAVTDNGKDYLSKRLTRAFADFGVEHIVCMPFAGEQKPHIERAFGKFLHDLVPLMEGFTGHNVAQAQDIRARKSFAQRLKEGKEGEVVEAGITKEEFETFITQWCLAEEHRVRDSGRLKDKSPAQVVNEWAAQYPIRRVKNLERLEYLLAVPFEKTVQKKGISHGSYYFIAPELGELIGRKVEIRVSPETPGRVAVFYDGEFVCMAVNPQLEDIDQAEVAARARARQQAANKVTREAQRIIRRQTKPGEVVESILNERLSGISNVSTLQVPENVSTSATEAAMAAKVAEELAIKAREMADKPMKYRELPLTPEQVNELKAAHNAEPAEDPIKKYIRLRRKEVITASEHAWMCRFESVRQLEAKAVNDGCAYPRPLIAGNGREEADEI